VSNLISETCTWHLLEGDHGLGELVECHDALVICRPEITKEVFRYGKKGYVLYVGVMFGVISDYWRSQVSLLYVSSCPHNDGCCGSCCTSTNGITKHRKLTSHHQDKLKPPTQSAKNIPMILSQPQLPVTPVCPASCTRTKGSAEFRCVTHRSTDERIAREI
jgi:hypothetical protein